MISKTPFHLETSMMSMKVNILDASAMIRGKG